MNRFDKDPNRFEKPKKQYSRKKRSLGKPGPLFILKKGKRGK